MKRSLMSCVLAALVVAELLVSVAPARAQTPLPGTAAAAQLPEVEMTCLAGQVDLNSAPVADLTAALAIDTPIANRVVEFRPYLRPSDLLVVAGIGPDRLASILASGRSCTVPAATPPQTENVCVDGKVDLQSATSAEIATRLGVSKNAGDSIVKARPFSTLRHVTPERVPGVGKGTL